VQISTTATARLQLRAWSPVRPAAFGGFIIDSRPRR